MKVDYVHFLFSLLFQAAYFGLIYKVCVRWHKGDSITAPKRKRRENRTCVLRSKKGRENRTFVYRSKKKRENRTFVFRSKKKRRETTK